MRATNAAGGTDSPAISVTTAEAVPSSVLPPTVGPVPGRSDQLRITWSAPRRPNGVVRYYVLQRNQSTPWNVPPSMELVPLVYVDSGLIADTIYSYTVSACTSTGCTHSGPSTARTSEDIPSSMSAPVATVLSSSAIQVSWTAPLQPNGKISRYELLMNGTTVYAGLNDTRVVSNLQPYVLYEFVVRACTSAGCASGPPTLARPDEAPPTQLSAPAVHVTGSRSTEVTWSPPANPNGRITAYELRRNGTLIQQTTSTWYVDYDCVPGTTYAYRVSAYNSRGGVDSPTTHVTTFSSAPEGLSAPRLAALSWSDVAASWQTPASPNGDIVNYTLYMARRVVYTGLSMSTVVRHLSPWTNYSFHVSACNRGGCAVSGVARVTTLEAAPSGLDPPTLTATGVRQVLVQWAVPRSPNGVVVRYELYRRDGNDTAMQGI